MKGPRSSQRRIRAKLKVRLLQHRTPSFTSLFKIAHFPNTHQNSCSWEEELNHLQSKPGQSIHLPKLAKAKTSKTSCNAILLPKAVSAVLFSKGHWGGKLPNNNSTRCCKCHHTPKLIPSCTASAATFFAILL